MALWTGIPPPRATGAVFLDRHAAVLRRACARAAPARGAGDLRRALDQMRARGTTVAVVSHHRDNELALDAGEFAVVHERVCAALGRVDLWCVCLVAENGRCACTDGEGPLAEGPRAVGVPPQRCVVVSETDRLSRAAATAGVMVVPSTDGEGLAEFVARSPG